MNTTLSQLRARIARVALGMCTVSLLSFGVISCNQQATAPESSSNTALRFEPDQKLAAAVEAMSKSDADPLGVPQDPVLEGKLKHAKDVQGRHTGELMKMEGVIGTGVGIEADGSTSLVVLARHGNVHGVPNLVEDQKTRVEVVGDVHPLAVYTGSYRPVPCGVSIGNNKENAAGTLGCAVNIGGYAYMLSNNHVMARQNLASIGESIGQPGPYDNGGYVAPQVATLSAYNRISYITNNSFDAAVARYTTSGYASMVNNLYTPNHATVQPSVGMLVKKTGRTTGLTHGQISAINVTIQVGYIGGTATFTNQIYVPGTFIQAGDSGSLMVTESGNYPVGLCFAGSSTASFASPIQPVLQYFGATVIGN